MANFRALTIQSGQYKQQQDADTLIVGAGITTAAGNLSLSSFGGTTNLNDNVSLAAGKSLSAAAGAGSLDFSAATGIFKTSTGAVTIGGGAAAVTITAGAASTWSSSSGALTLSSAAAATWSTAAGALTLNGATTLELQGAGSTAVSVTSTGAVVQAGKTLSTTGTGNINLPNNGSAKFQVEGVAVGANVTAANLDTLTGGGATTLHSHAGTGNVTLSGTAGETIAAGAPVSVKDLAGVPALYNADSNGTAPLPNVFGIADSSVVVTNPLVVILAGERAIPDAIWDSVPATGDVGSFAFLSETVGKLTLTAPSTSGSTVVKVGIVTRGGAGAVKITVYLGEPVVL